MGLLDDAIREHLDLKRRRGADPAEVERAEREALGPVRREPAPLQDDELLATHEPAAYAEPDEWEPQADHPAEPPAAVVPALELTESVVPPSDALDDYGDGEDDVFEDERDSPMPVRAPSASYAPVDPAIPPPRPAAPPPAESDELLGETVEYDVEQAFEEERELPSRPQPAAPADGQPPASDEDVLEETPEFLQDAPEHDRLWFEQRPPRDFDFEG